MSVADSGRPMCAGCNEPIPDYAGPLGIQTYSVNGFPTCVECFGFAAKTAAPRAPAEPEEAGSPPATKEITKSDIGRDCGPDCTACMDPFDKSPNPLTPATNGWIRCPTCEQVVQLPHECSLDDSLANGKFGEAIVVTVRRARSAEARAEFAESLLCAMAFDHQRSGDATGEPCALWVPCVFCEVSRQRWIQSPDTTDSGNPLASKTKTP